MGCTMVERSVTNVIKEREAENEQSLSQAS